MSKSKATPRKQEFDFSMPRGFSLKRMRSSMQQQRPKRAQAGFGDYSKPFVWPAFFANRKKTIDSQIDTAKAWRMVKAADRMQNVEWYLETADSAWVYDALISCLELSVLPALAGKVRPFTYAGTLRIDAAKLGDTWLQVEERVIDNIKYNTLDRYVFLMVFYDHTGREAVVVMWIEQGNIEIFTPFADWWKDNKLLQSVTCQAIFYIQKHWMRLDVTNPSCAAIQRVYKYQTAITVGRYSNIWSLYFIVLRMQLPQEKVQALLQNTANTYEMFECAQNTFQGVGRIASGCIENMTTTPGTAGDFARRYYPTMFAQDASTPAQIVRGGVQDIQQAFLACESLTPADVAFTDLSDVLPKGTAVTGVAQWPPKYWEAEFAGTKEFKEYFMFAEIPEASQPVFYF